MSRNEGSPSEPPAEAYQYLWQSDPRYAPGAAQGEVETPAEKRYKETEEARRRDAENANKPARPEYSNVQLETKAMFLQEIPDLYDIYKAALEHDRLRGWAWGEGAASSSKEMFRYAVTYLIEAEALHQLERTRSQSGERLNDGEKAKLDMYESQLQANFGPKGKESDQALGEIRKAATAVIGAGIGARNIEDAFNLKLAELQ